MISLIEGLLIIISEVLQADTTLDQPHLLNRPHRQPSVIVPRLYADIMIIKTGLRHLLSGWYQQTACLMSPKNNVIRNLGRIIVGVLGY